MIAGGDKTPFTPGEFDSCRYKPRLNSFRESYCEGQERFIQLYFEKRDMIPGEGGVISG